MPNKIAIIGLYGPMLSHSSAMNRISGATSTRDFAALVNQAASDPDVAHIVLDIAPPGGEAYSIDVAVGAVRAAKQVKPVTAVTEEVMASAAYWVASQADTLIASENSMVGSISVVYSHTDRTQWNEQQGIKRTVLSTGDKKAVGSPDVPLDDAGRTEMLRVAQSYHDQFVGAVAEGRGQTVEHVQSNWADGRVETGLVAAQIGLVDKVGTLESTIQDIISGMQASSSVPVLSLSNLGNYR